MAIGEDFVSEILELLDWKRASSGSMRRSGPRPDPEAGWHRWRDVRAELFRDHPQSPRPGFDALRYFAYDPALALPRRRRAGRGRAPEIAGSGDEPVVSPASRSPASAAHELELFWLEAYGGGLFLPFRDATAGSETYGGGRYLLDTVKGADLGTDGRQARPRLQLRLQPVVQLRPAVGLPPLAAGEPAARAIRAGGAGAEKPEVGLEPTASALQERCSAS